jgi:hypothetical protein
MFFLASLNNADDCEPCNKKRMGWRQCVYCSTGVKSTEFTNGEALVAHLKNNHGNCVYQCAYCFYRSASKSNVLLHEVRLRNFFSDIVSIYRINNWFKTDMGIWFVNCMDLGMV